MQDLVSHSELYHFGNEIISLIAEGKSLWHSKKCNCSCPGTVRGWDICRYSYEQALVMYKYDIEGLKLIICMIYKGLITQKGSSKFLAALVCFTNRVPSWANKILPTVCLLFRMSHFRNYLTSDMICSLQKCYKKRDMILKWYQNAWGSDRKFVNILHRDGLALPGHWWAQVPVPVVKIHCHMRKGLPFLHKVKCHYNAVQISKILHK